MFKRLTIKIQKLMEKTIRKITKFKIQKGQLKIQNLSLKLNLQTNLTFIISEQDL